MRSRAYVLGRWTFSFQFAEQYIHLSPSSNKVSVHGASLSMKRRFKRAWAAPAGFTHGQPRIVVTPAGLIMLEALAADGAPQSMGASTLGISISAFKKMLASDDDKVRRLFILVSKPNLGRSRRTD